MYGINCSRSIYSAVLPLIFLALPIISTCRARPAVKYILPCSESLLIESERIMLGETGTTETGANRGDVEKYTASAGLPPGAPYCAAAQYYCFFKAAVLLRMQEKIPIPKTGLSMNILQFAKKRGIRQPLHPARHDLVIWRQKGSSVRGHTERIISAGKAGWVTTIGFNVKCGSGKEGVFQKRRNIFHPLGRLVIAGLVGFDTGGGG